MMPGSDVNPDYEFGEDEAELVEIIERLSPEGKVRLRNKIVAMLLDVENAHTTPEVFDQGDLAERS
jgi:hypothetical protein